MGPSICYTKSALWRRVRFLSADYKSYPRLDSCPPHFCPPPSLPTSRAKYSTRARPESIRPLPPLPPSPHELTHTHTHTLSLSHTKSFSLIIIFVLEYYISIIHSSNSISYNLWYISCILPCCKTISLFLLLQGLDYFQLGASLWSLETRSQPGFDPRPDDWAVVWLQTQDAERAWQAGVLQLWSGGLPVPVAGWCGVSEAGYFCYMLGSPFPPGKWTLTDKSVWLCAGFSFKQALFIHLICLNSFGQKLHLVSQCTMSSEVNFYRECFSLNNDGPLWVCVT